MSRNFDSCVPIRPRRGFATMVLFALIPLLGMSALVIDIGTLQVARSQLQGSIDAAALAGVGYLDGTEGGLSLAISQTQAFAASNPVLDDPVQLAAGEDIVTGRYDKELDEFVSTSDPTLVNAIYVEKSLGGLTTFFAGAAFGVGVVDATATSLARTGDIYAAGEVDCFLPLAVPDCVVDESATFESVILRMSSAQLDNTGWANPDGSVDDTYVTNQLSDDCSSSPAVVGDLVSLQNGQMNTAFKMIHDLLEASTETWDGDRLGPIPPQMGTAEYLALHPDSDSDSVLSSYGNVIQGPVIMFEPTHGACGAEEQFNQDSTITGFAWAVVHDIDDQGDGKNISVSLDLTYEHEVGSDKGGIDGGNVTWQDDHQLVY